MSNSTISSGTAALQAARAGERHRQRRAATPSAVHRRRAAARSTRPVHHQPCIGGAHSYKHSTTSALNPLLQRILTTLTNWSAPHLCATSSSGGAVRCGRKGVGSARSRPCQTRSASRSADRQLTPLQHSHGSRAAFVPEQRRVGVCVCVRGCGWAAAAAGCHPSLPASFDAGWPT